MYGGAVQGSRAGMLARLCLVSLALHRVRAWQVSSLVPAHPLRQSACGTRPRVPFAYEFVGARMPCAPDYVSTFVYVARTDIQYAPGKDIPHSEVSKAFEGSSTTRREVTCVTLCPQVATSHHSGTRDHIIIARYAQRLRKCRRQVQESPWRRGRRQRYSHHQIRGPSY